MRCIVTALILLGASYLASAGEALNYTANGGTFKGYIARPATSGEKRAGVLTLPSVVRSSKCPSRNHAAADVKYWEAMKSLFETVLR